MWSISLLSVVVAALLGFAVGGLWYGPLFLKVWQREAGITDAAMQKRHPAWVFGGAFVLQLFAAYFMGHTFATYGNLSPNATIMTALGIALAFIVTAFGVNYLFAGRSVKLWLIDSGYYVVTYTSMGAAFAWIG
ncbi:MAG: DUF1761 domain-containing protein [Novosphingobium sp.]